MYSNNKIAMSPQSYGGPSEGSASLYAPKMNCAVGFSLIWKSRSAVPYIYERVGCYENQR